MLNCSPAVVVTSNASGPRGLSGWSPVLAYQDGDSGIGLYVVDWFGGTGIKPAVGQFVGAVEITTANFTPVSPQPTPSTGAVQYFDENDNILKIKFSDGSILELRP